MKAWAKSFYLSAAWEKTRAAYLMSQDYICERCGQPAKIVHHIRKEYTEVSELQNSNGKPQIIIQQAPIATGQQAEPQQTPPAAAGEPAGGLGEKEGVNNAD